MLINPDSLAALDSIKKQVTQNEKVVFVSGNFNIIHPGHLRLLRFASECGDYLVVGVQSDSFGETILPEELRLEGVTSTSWVDFAFILRDPPARFISELKPKIVAKGKEHESFFNPELEVLKSYGGKLLFSSGDLSFSSLDLIRSEFQNINLSTILKPCGFLQHHDFSKEDLKAVLGKLKDLRVCVLGETIIDEYVRCDPLGMSQEDPTIVVTPIMREKFMGGAAIVAAHARGMGAEVHFFSVHGKDELAFFANEQMEAYKVTNHFLEDESRPTTLKQRFQIDGKTLLRVNHLRQHAIGKDLQEKIFCEVKPLLENTDLLIFSDFNYGMLRQNLVDRVIEECLKKGVMMVADSQCSSQVGDVSRFKEMTLLTPTEREARLALQDFDSGLVVLAESLRKKSSAKNIFLTLDAEGLLIHAATSKKDKWLTDRLPAFNTAPKDLAGAGDSMLTLASMSLAAGSDIWKSAYLGSLAAASQVGRVGNIPIRLEDLYAEIDN